MRAAIFGFAMATLPLRTGAVKAIRFAYALVGHSQDRGYAQRHIGVTRE